MVQQLLKIMRYKYSIKEDDKHKIKFNKRSNIYLEMHSNFLFYENPPDILLSYWVPSLERISPLIIFTIRHYIKFLFCFKQHMNSYLLLIRIRAVTEVAR